jgi:nucleoside-diphosphate-sugar epimerase
MTDRTIAVIGWRPEISIEDGIGRVIRWCQTQP